MLQSQTYMSTQEAAGSLGVTDGRVRQMLIAGELAGQKLGQRSWAIPSAEVDRIKKRRDPKPTP